MTTAVRVSFSPCMTHACRDVEDIWWDIRRQVMHSRWGARVSCSAGHDLKNQVAGLMCVRACARMCMHAAKVGPRYVRE